MSVILPYCHIFTVMPYFQKNVTKSKNNILIQSLNTVQKNNERKPCKVWLPTFKK